jgi:hypothetical protein
MEFLSKDYKICDNKNHTQESKLFDPEKSIVFLWKERWNGVLRRAIGRRLVHQLSQKTHDGAL